MTSELWFHCVRDLDERWVINLFRWSEHWAFYFCLYPFQMHRCNRIESSELEKISASALCPCNIFNWNSSQEQMQFIPAKDWLSLKWDVSLINRYLNRNEMDSFLFSFFFFTRNRNIISNCNQQTAHNRAKLMCKFIILHCD